MEPEQKPCKRCGDESPAGDYCGAVCRAGSECRIERSLVHCELKFERYQWLRELAKEVGQYGVIYMVYNLEDGAERALKVQPYIDDMFPASREKADREMQIACTLSGRPGFLRLHDYWICNVQPVDHVFRRAAEKRYLLNQRKLFYMEMELARGTLQDLIEQRTPVSRIDKLCFLFETLYALEEARRELGFVHRDLHAGNVFFVWEREPRSYELEDEARSVVQISSIFRPLIGDFGSSQLGVAVNAEAYEMELTMLFAAQADWGQKDVKLGPIRRARLAKDASYGRLLVAIIDKIEALQESV
jgi:serine/threonine protein kinase